MWWHSYFGCDGIPHQRPLLCRLVGTRCPSFFNSTTLTREEKIVALELIGGYLIMDVTPDRYRPFQESAPKIGLQLWRHATSLRYFPADGEPPLPKIPVPTEASVAMFGSLVEVMTMQDMLIIDGRAL